MCHVNTSMSSRQCLLELQREAAFLWTSELENVATLCFRAFEGSNYNVRVSVAKLLGTLLAAAVEPRQPAGTIPQHAGIKAFKPLWVSWKMHRHNKQTAERTVLIMII